jgi:hypothetical protein
MSQSQRRQRAHLAPAPTAPQTAESAAPAESQEAHDLRQAINRMGQAIQAQGAHLDIGLINTTAQANAACQMLVELGLCSGEQMDVMILHNVKGMLATLLQSVEETKLAQKRAAQGVQVVERPKLMVARH